MRNVIPIRAVLLLLLAAVLLAEGAGLSGCANMIPPTGGPRDSIAPILVSAAPRDSTRNFDRNRITFEFNEFVELDNIMENLVVSPVPKVMPVVESKLRTVSVRLKDTLEPNTTYTLHFGNAIRDINEGNRIQNFTYLFTTGNTFDSLRLGGRVILAETGGRDSTLIVMLHTSPDDSAVINDRPRYFTRLDSSGNFLFRNLPAGTFRIYALKDQGMKRYQSKDQLFAFADSPVTVSPNTPNIVLYAYREQADTRNAGATTGSTGATTRQPRTNTQDKLLRITNNISDDQLDLLNPLEIRFANPLKTFDTTKIRFTDEEFRDIRGYPFTLDSTRRIATLNFPWAPNTAYNIIVDRDFAEDSLGRKILRNDTLSFRTRRESDYGELKLRFTNLDLSSRPVLLFTQGDQVRYTHVFTGRNVNVRRFVPGEYELRILFDANRNGKWDPGEFFGERRQPERIQPVSRRLNVKPNWVTEVDITL